MIRERVDKPKFIDEPPVKPKPAEILLPSKVCGTVEQFYSFIFSPNFSRF